MFIIRVNYPLMHLQVFKNGQSASSVHNTQYEAALKTSKSCTELPLFPFMPLLFKCAVIDANSSGSSEPACSQYKQTLVIKKYLIHNSEHSIEGCT